MTPVQAANLCLLHAAGLRTAEVGILATAIALMLREGGPIARAELRARSVAPADGRQFASRLRALVSKGKLFITSEGLITANPIVIEAYATVMNAEWPA